MFTWICPQCGREVPPAYNDCPDCSNEDRSGRRRTAAAQPGRATSVRAATAAARTAAALLPAAAHHRRSRRIIRRSRHPRRRNRTIRQQPQPHAAAAAASGRILCGARPRARTESARMADDHSLRHGHRRRRLRHDLGGVHQSQFGRQRPRAHRQRGEPGGQARRQDQPATEIHRDLRRALRGGRQEEDDGEVRPHQPLHRRYQRPDRQRHHLGPHAEIRGRRAGNFLLQHQSGAHGIEGTLRAAQHQAQDLRVARLAEPHHRRADHRARGA